MSPLRAPVYKGSGEPAGEIDLAEAVFGMKPHSAVLHEAVRWQLAGRHRGTHATLTRGMVSRSTRKLYRQKGTGRARHGGRGAPVFVGGGIAFGPQPRDYAYTLNKKVRRLAVRSALSARAAEGRIAVLDGLDLDTPKTKTLADALRAPRGSAAGGSVLLVTAMPHEAVERSAANLTGVRVIAVPALNVHAILVADRIVFTRDGLQRLVEALA
jgi:large subunit ribosomal protein L4